MPAVTNTTPAPLHLSDKIKIAIRPSSSASICFKETDMRNRTGKPAVPFTLNDAQGHPHRLEDYRGHWLLLVFHRHLG